MEQTTWQNYHVFPPFHHDKTLNAAKLCESA